MVLTCPLIQSYSVLVSNNGTHIQEYLKCPRLHLKHLRGQVIRQAEDERLFVVSLDGAKRGIRDVLAMNDIFQATLLSYYSCLTARHLSHR